MYNIPEISVIVEPKVVVVFPFPLIFTTSPFHCPQEQTSGFASILKAHGVQESAPQNGVTVTR